MIDTQKMDVIFGTITRFVSIVNISKAITTLSNEKHLEQIIESNHYLSIIIQAIFGLVWRCIALSCLR